MSTLTTLGRTDVPVGRRVTERRVDPLRALAGRTVARISHALSVWRTARHLARLDSRMLQDIGLRRIGNRYFTHGGYDLVSVIPRTRRPRTAWIDSDDVEMPLRATAQRMKVST